MTTKVTTVVKPAVAAVPSPKPRSPIDDLRDNLTKMEGQFKLALPPHVSTEKFIRTVVTAIQQQAALLDCDRKTLFAACLECATDGLLPDGREAVLVPRKNKSGGKDACYMPMVGGLLKLARNSGELGSISPNIVCENDLFELWTDETGEHITHRPKLDGPRGEITHAYCIARMKDASVYIEVMSHLEIEQVRGSSSAGGSGPWSDWYGEMAKKTVIRRLSKRLPMSTDLERVIHRDDSLYEIDGKTSQGSIADGTKKSRLQNLVADKRPMESIPVEPGDTAQAEPALVPAPAKAGA